MNKFIFGILFLLSACSSDSSSTNKPTPTPTTPPKAICAGKTRTLQATAADGEVYCPNGCTQTQAWTPGDLIQIPAGHWSLIDIGNVVGTASCPITLANKGGLVTADIVRFRSGAQYIKLLGSGDTQTSYGIKVQATSGVAVYSGASDFEIGYVEVASGDVGFMVKREPDAADITTQYPYVQDNISIHDNYIHDVNGEGMYIGHTSPSADAAHGNLVPSRLNHVTIKHNTVDHTGWDGIQLSNCRNGGEISENSVSHFGIEDVDSQRAGIILGANCSGSIHNNTVNDGTGNGIQVFGFGLIKVYSNTITEAGKTATVSYGEEAFDSNAYITTPETNAKQQLVISENTVYTSSPSPGRRGAIRINDDFSNLLPSTIKNNDMWLTGASSSTWLSQYLLGPSGTTKTGNTLHNQGF